MLKLLFLMYRFRGYYYYDRMRRFGESDRSFFAAVLVSGNLIFCLVSFTGLLGLVLGIDLNHIIHEYFLVLLVVMFCNFGLNYFILAKKITYVRLTKEFESINQKQYLRMKIVSGGIIFASLGFAMLLAYIARRAG
jgi:hypothetical protein